MDTLKQGQILDEAMCISHRANTSGLMSRVLDNGLGDQYSIPGQVIPKTKKNSTWYRLT